jgi:CMP-N,N'-diacetyllegionaminic acid synthase
VASVLPASPAIVGIIPARMGSKGIPRKNVASLGGRPLISYMLSAVLDSARLTDVAVSSDDEEILNVASTYGRGSTTLIKRPAELADDAAPSLPVIQHAVATLEARRSRPYDYVVMFQCTTPLVEARDIAGALDLLVKGNADAVMTVFKSNESHPAKAKKLGADGRLTQYLPEVPETQFTRQQFEPVYRRNGAVYASRRDVVMLQNRLYGGDDLVTLGYEMPEERSIDINSPLDLAVAETLLKNRS